MRPTRKAVSIAIVVLSAHVLGWPKPLPCGQQNWVLDEALKATSAEQYRAAALETLEAVAEGKPKEAIVASALRAGLGLFARPEVSSGFEYTCARTYAMDRIGASGLPEAIEYLKSITVEKIGPDSTETIYPAAQLALYKALYRQKSDPREQIAFLEHQLVAPSHGVVGWWALNELCNRGAMDSLQEIRKHLRASWRGSYGDEQIRFCEARMDIVNRNPDRTKALASALSLEETLRDADLAVTRWLIEQLLSMHSREADAVLDAYAAAVEQRFPDTPSVMSVPRNAMLHGLARQIREAQVPRQQQK